MRTPPLLADFIHARPCKPFCEKLLTLPKFLFDAYIYPKVPSALLPFCICRESWMEDAILNAREVIEVNRKAVRIIANSAARLRTLFFLK